MKEKKVLVLQNRFKSKVLWTSTIANIATIVGILSPEFDLEPWVKITGVVIVLLVEFGILNNSSFKNKV
jgi:hypothetical protein